MNKRPIAVTIISLLLIAAGVIGLAYHLRDLKPRPFPTDVVSVSILRVMAIVCGAFMLRGSNWARWLAMAWIGFHVIISAYHSAAQVLMHVLLFGLFAFFLFQSTASNYFHARWTEAG